MSTREQKRLQELNEKKLLGLVKLPGNSQCCDCGASGPRWASFNIGCFLCIRCGGIHRRMGTHISKVKSISLDKWTPEQLQSMEAWGNQKVNELYLHNAGSRHVPTDDDGMEQYIRDKYERKRFLRPGARVAPDQGATPSTTRDSPAMDTALRSLHDMGFTDMARNRSALNRTNGNVPAAIELMCQQAELPSPMKTNNNSVDPRLAQLKAMGFEDMAANIVALRQSKGSVERAIELLVSREAPPLPSRTPAKASVVLGIPQPPAKATNNQSEDLFGDFTSAFTPPASSQSQPKANDTFGDFVFPTLEPPPTSSSQTTAAPPPPNPTSPVKGDKDYIMSLFGSSQPTSQFGAPQQSNMSQFGAPQQSNMSQFGVPQQSNMNPFGAPQQSNMNPFGAPQQSSMSPPSQFGAQPPSYQSGLNGFSFPPAQSQPMSPPGGGQSSQFASFTTSPPSHHQQANSGSVSQLDSAFASLDPFKQFASPPRAPASNSSHRPPSSTTPAPTTTSAPQQDLLDLL